MTSLRETLLQHLELAAQAYGSDLPLPRGTAIALPRAAPTAPTAPPQSQQVQHAVPPPPPREQPQQQPQQQQQATAEPARTGDAAADLAAFRAQLLGCTRCKLHQGRRQVVFGEGNPRARVLFVGEAPGAVEDQTGRPFVGPAGQLLDRIVEGAMGMRRQDVFIANINKCRPPGNREPEPDEVAACLPFLKQQVAMVQPEVIVALGRTAAHNLLGTTEPMRALRGRSLAYEGIPVVVTWHPAFLLRDPSHKRETWEDIKRVNRILGLPEVPPAGSGASGLQT